MNLAWKQCLSLGDDASLDCPTLVSLPVAHELAAAVDIALTEVAQVARPGSRLCLLSGARYEYTPLGALRRNGVVVSGSRLLHPSVTGTAEGARLHADCLAFLLDAPTIIDRLQRRTA